MKKLISILMALVMAFTLCVPAFAADDGYVYNTDYEGNPVIIVRGIDFAGLTYEDGTKALQVDASQIMSLLFKAFWSSLTLQGEETIADGIFEVAKGIFEPISPNREGNATNGVSMVQYPGPVSDYPELLYSLTDGAEPGIVKTAVEKYGPQNTYFFTYDWRKTPQQLAQELNSYVVMAKENSGKDKVNIICASMGCMVTTAYLYYYGSDSVDSCVYLSGAHNGTYVCGDALNGRIVFESQVLVDFLNYSAGNNLVLKLFFGLFKSLGAVDFITFVINDTVQTSFDRANDVMLRDSLGTMCGLWALCPDADFESAVENIFGGHEADYPVLMEKLEETKRFVFSTQETFESAMANGTKISFVSNYNQPLIPIYERATVNGDSVLETELTSNFATVANFGEALSNDYLAGKDRALVSNDRVVDASTAWFVENTWYVKDAPHVAADYGTEFSDFTFTLLESPVQPTVDTFPQYPRFMAADAELNLTAN
ncbi:MAG: hypothetical protein IKV44_05895 [Clostridia bacterium]|nr:hypothetical protein [Clostridia bacterium]